MQLLLIDNRINNVETVTDSLLDNVEFVLVDFYNDTYDTLISKIQSKKYDPECAYILKYVPELSSVPIKDIHDWENKHKKYLNEGVKYLAPKVDYKKAYHNATKELLRVHKLKF